MVQMKNWLLKEKCFKLDLRAVPTARPSDEHNTATLTMPSYLHEGTHSFKKAPKNLCANKFT